MKHYKRVVTKQFRKDLRRLQKAGYALSKLEGIIDLLVEDRELPEACRDHSLRGVLRGSRECHISPDWLLRYAKNEDCLVLLLISIGDHRRVLGVE